MLLFNGTGVASVGNLQAQKSIAKLIIKKNAAFTSETLNVKIIGSGENKPICNGDAVVDLAEMAQFQEGAFLKFKTGGFEIVSVDLCAGGAIKLKDEEYISIAMDSMATGSAYEIYGLEMPNVLMEHIEYGRVDVPIGTGTVQKVLDVQTDRLLAITKTTNIKQIDIVWANGQSTTWLYEELEALMRDSNDLVYTTGSTIATGTAGDTVSFFNQLLWILDVHDAVTVTVSTNGTSAVAVTRVKDKIKS